MSHARPGMRSAVIVAVISVVVLVGACLLAGHVWAPSGEPSPTADSPYPQEAEATPTPRSPEAAVELNTAALQELVEHTIFFGHRSVGANIVELGLPAVFAQYGVEFRSRESTVVESAGFTDYWLDQTEDPRSKLRDFDRTVRAMPPAGLPDIAFMKLGFVDVSATTDTAALFADYQSLMNDLEADFPDVLFVHVTISVHGWQPEDNAAIEQFNTRMRSAYADSGRFFDLAAAVSTCSGESRSALTDDGVRYFSICPDYTADGGHLNQRGAYAAATALLRLLVTLI